MKPASIIAMEKWWSANRHTLLVWIPAASLVLFLVSATLFIVATVATTIFLIGDAGYGDTYILYDVLHFQKTGQIYRDVPPSLPACAVQSSCLHEACEPLRLGTPSQAVL